MKKLLILFILLTIFLSGCAFDLNGWVVPDDPGFLALVQELDTPEKIGNYMLNNFIYEIHDIPLTPYQLYKTKKGDCDDLAIFGIFIANYHGYKTYHITIVLENGMGHYLAVYVENNKYNYSNNLNYCPVNVSTFKEIISHSFKHDIWKTYTVYDYWNDVVEEITK